MIEKACLRRGYRIYVNFRKNSILGRGRASIETVKAGTQYSRQNINKP